MLLYKNNFKHFYKIAIIYLILWVSVILCINDKFIIGFFTFTIANIAIPIWFFIANIVSEVYGYKYFKKLILYGILVQISAIIVALIITCSLKYNILLVNIKNVTYMQLIHNLPRMVLSNILALFCFWGINFFIIKKLQYLLDGKYFMLRSSGISLIGELSFIILVNLMSLSHNFSIDLKINIIISALLLNLIFNMILIIPSNIIINLLKKVENFQYNKIENKDSIFDIIYKHAQFLNK